MGLIRLIILALLGWIAYGLYRRYQQHATKRDDSLNAPSQPDQLGSERMVRCQQCQLHFPEREAFMKDGHYYCCQEHRDHV
ncbi:MAG: hypothetical protein HQL49_01580 [Gammaproteobacteria bacterium]|nr:hypothetical protein [Gammaproteobacteria bacterium]